MNVNDMLVFADVVERGGFTAAAAAIGLPKSNVSRKITRLENALGVRLLERTTRKHSLTEIGRTYYEHCARIKEEIESADAAIEHLSALPRGCLRVCASVTVGQSLIASHLAGFASAYPDVVVDFRLTNRPVDLLEEGFDVAIRVGESPDSNLVAKHLCSQELHLYAAPEYLKSNDAPLTVPEDLQHHRCLHMNAVREQPRWPLRKSAETRYVVFEPAFSCDDFQVLCQLAVDALGVAQLPDYMCRDLVLKGSLVRVLDEWIGATVNFNTIVPSRKGVTPKVRAFLDYFSAACKSG